MLVAKKENKQYKFSEADTSAKKAYAAQGYDIYDENGKLVEASALAKVSAEEYKKLQKELEDVKEELAKAKAAKKNGKTSKATDDQGEPTE